MRRRRGWWRGDPGGKRRPNHLVMAGIGLLALLACTAEDPAVTPTPTSTASPPASVAATGERSVTGVLLTLPPPPPGGFDPAVTVRFDGAPAIRAEVARTPQQRARGLMQRDRLPDGTGMLFVFPRRSTGGFWMLGTLVPLSIAYVDGDRVVSTAEMEPCPTQNCPSYRPAGAYTIAVEAPAGFFPRHGVAAGTRMTIEGGTTAPE